MPSTQRSTVISTAPDHDHHDREAMHCRQLLQQRRWSDAMRARREREASMWSLQGRIRGFFRPIWLKLVTAFFAALALAYFILRMMGAL
jgi:hypothetical protein